MSTSPPPASPSVAVSGQRTLASVGHLSALVGLIGVPSVLGPLVVLLTTREDPVARREATEALNFNLSVLLYLLTGAVATVATLGIGLLVLLPAAIVGAVAWFVLVVVAAARASEGEAFRYPLTIRLVR